MPRPRKCRKVGFVPNNQCFRPQVQSSAEVVLSVEEVESIRLSDFLELEQDDAANSMNVSRGTFQRIVHTARHKTADALVNGKAIRIDGGNYELSDGRLCCRRHTGNCRFKDCEKCENCEQYKTE